MISERATGIARSARGELCLRIDIAALSDLRRTVAVFRAGEDGFESAGAFVSDGRPVDIAIGDLNGDGSAEILLSDPFGHRLLLLRLVHSTGPTETHSFR